MTRSLHLVSDLDGTWIHPEGGGETLRKLEAFLEAHPGIVLTFATGRSLHSALRVLSGVVQVWPRHFITDVGTALYHRQEDGNWTEDADYSAWVESRWNPEPLDRRFEWWIPSGVRRQPRVLATRRLALEVTGGREVLTAAEDLRENLEKIGMAAEVLATGSCLDVLPCGVDKGAAAAFLQARYALPRPMVACGDSENDLGLFRVADLPVLMADSSLSLDASGMPTERVRRSSFSGPEGILETLRALVTDGEGRP